MTEEIFSQVDGNISRQGIDIIEITDGLKAFPLFRFDNLKFPGIGNDLAGKNRISCAGYIDNMPGIFCPYMDVGRRRTNFGFA